MQVYNPKETEFSKRLHIKTKAVICGQLKFWGYDRMKRMDGNGV